MAVRALAGRSGATGSGRGLAGKTKIPSPQDGQRKAWYPPVLWPRNRWPNGQTTL